MGEASQRDDREPKAAWAWLLSIVAVLTALTASPASAAGSAPWYSVQPARPHAISDVSCPTVSICRAAYPDAVLATADGGTTWIRQTNGVPKVSLSGISCPTSSDCWAVGGNNVIIHSGDGGNSWATQASPLNPSYPTAAAMASVSCPSTTICFAVGYYSAKSPGPGFVIATKNGGASWTDQTPGQVGPIAYLDCPGVLTCYATGAFGQLLATKDGATWAAQNSGVNEDLNEISCATTATCLAAGPGAGVIATTDGGAHWASHTTSFSGSGGVVGMSCPTASHCIATGMDNRSGPDLTAAVSDNGGSTWVTTYAPDIAGWLVAVSCASITHCVAAGPSGWVARTDDGGQHWTTSNVQPVPVAPSRAWWSVVAGPAPQGRIAGRPNADATTNAVDTPYLPTNPDRDLTAFGLHVSEVVRFAERLVLSEARTQARPSPE